MEPKPEQIFDKSKKLIRYNLDPFPNSFSPWFYSFSSRSAVKSVFAFPGKTIKPILAKIKTPPKNVCGGSFSSQKNAPMTTAISGVTSEIIIAFVDSILLKSQ